MLRLFVAVPIPDAVLDAVAGVVDPLRAGGADVSWARPETLHVTLRFLGDTDPDRVPALADALRAALAPFPGPEVRIAGGGAFPSLRAPRVLWIGVDAPLAPVAAAVDATVQAVLGLPPEDRAFRPHLTIGRARSGRPVREAQALAAVGELGRFRADCATLYRSELSPKGARHTVLETFLFQGA